MAVEGVDWGAGYGLLYLFRDMADLGGEGGREDILFREGKPPKCNALFGHNLSQ